MARFRLRAHTLQVATETWNHKISPVCDLCNANDVQDEQHVHFHCTHPHVVSFCRMHICFLTQVPVMRAFSESILNCKYMFRQIVFDLTLS